MRFEKQVFTSDVTLDYNEFVDCEFRDCVVMYYGGEFSLVRTRMTSVRFGLGGSANLTLGFLRLVRAHGPELLDQLLDAAEPLKPDQSISIN